MKRLLLASASALAFSTAHASLCTPPNAAQFTNQKGDVCQVKVECGKVVKAKSKAKTKAKSKRKAKKKVRPIKQETTCPPQTVINNYYGAPTTAPDLDIEARQPENLPTPELIPQTQTPRSTPFFGLGMVHTPFGFGAARTQYVQIDTRYVSPSNPMPTPLPASGLLFGTVSALFSGWKLSKLRKASI
jgi:hypothetical protein